MKILFVSAEVAPFIKTGGLADAITRCLTAFRDTEGWAILQARGMREDHSWEASAREYAAMYGWALRSIDR
jgi:glycogen synthase